MGLGLLTAPGLTAGSATGFLLALGAGLCIAGYNVAARIQLDRGVGALEVPTGSFVLGGALLLPLLATQPLAWISTPSGAAMALYLGVATMGLANVLLTRGMRTLTPGPATTLMLTDPVVATVLGVVVLGETLAAVEVIGVLVILVGLFLQGVLASREAPEESEPSRFLCRLDAAPVPGIRSGRWPASLSARRSARGHRAHGHAHRIGPTPSGRARRVMHRHAPGDRTDASTGPVAAVRA